MSKLKNNLKRILRNLRTQDVGGKKVHFIYYIHFGFEVLHRSKVISKNIKKEIHCQLCKYAIKKLGNDKKFLIMLNGNQPEPAMACYTKEECLISAIREKRYSLRMLHKLEDSLSELKLVCPGEKFYDNDTYYKANKQIYIDMSNITIKVLKKYYKNFK